MGYDYMHELDELVKTMKRTHSHLIDSMTTTPSSASADTLAESNDSKTVKSSKSDLAAEEETTDQISELAEAQEEREAPREKDEIELLAERQAEQYLQKYIQTYGNPFAHVAARLVASPNYNFEMQRMQQLRYQVQQQQFQQQSFQFQQQQRFMPQQQFYPQQQMMHGHMPYYWPCQHHCAPIQNYQTPVSVVNPTPMNTETIEQKTSATLEAIEDEVQDEEYEVNTAGIKEAEEEYEDIEQPNYTDAEEGAETMEEIGNGSSSYQLPEDEAISEGAETGDFVSEDGTEKPREEVLCNACSAPIKAQDSEEVSPAETIAPQPEEEQYTQPPMTHAESSVPPKIVSISYNDPSHTSYYADLLNHVIKALPYLNLEHAAYDDWSQQVNYQVQTYY